MSSTSLFPVPEAVAARRLDRRGAVFKLYQQSLQDPDGFWREQAQAAALDQALHQGEEHELHRRCRDQMVRGRHAQRRPTTASTGISPSAPTRPRSCGKATTRDEQRHVSYAELHESVCRLANVLQGARRQEGRPRHHLHADDPRGGLRHARLRADRRRSIPSSSAASRPTASSAASRIALRHRHHRR